MATVMQVMSVQSQTTVVVHIRDHEELGPLAKKIIPHNTFMKSGSICEEV